MSNLSEQKLITIVPSSISGDKTIRNISAATDPGLRKISRDTLLLLLLPRLDELPEKIVDALAWQYHVDFYDDAATLEKKRALVKQSIKWNRRKGTPSVVEEVCTAIFKSAKIEENWEYGGKPYHFKVVMITDQQPVPRHRAHEKCSLLAGRGVFSQKLAENNLLCTSCCLRKSYQYLSCSFQDVGYIRYCT